MQQVQLSTDYVHTVAYSHLKYSYKYEPVYTRYITVYTGIYAYMISINSKSSCNAFLSTYQCIPGILLYMLVNTGTHWYILLNPSNKRSFHYRNPKVHHSFEDRHDVQRPKDGKLPKIRFQHTEPAHMPCCTT